MINLHEIDVGPTSLHSEGHAACLMLRFPFATSGADETPRFLGAS